MSILSFFNGHYKRQIEFQQTLINNQRNDIKELQTLLLSRPEVLEEAPPVVTKPQEPGTVVTGWLSPKQRVRNHIQAISPIAALSLLTPEDEKFLRERNQ